MLQCRGICFINHEIELSPIHGNNCNLCDAAKELNDGAVSKNY